MSDRTLAQSEANRAARDWWESLTWEQRIEAHRRAAPTAPAPTDCPECQGLRRVLVDIDNSELCPMCVSVNGAPPLWPPSKPGVDLKAQNDAWNDAIEAAAATMANGDLMEAPDHEPWFINRWKSVRALRRSAPAEGDPRKIALEARNTPES